MSQTPEIMLAIGHLSRWLNQNSVAADGTEIIIRFPSKPLMGIADTLFQDDMREHRMIGIGPSFGEPTVSDPKQVVMMMGLRIRFECAE